jgi:hypothetical protein
MAMLLERGADASLLHRSRVGRNPDIHLQYINDLRVELVVATRNRSDVGLEAYHSDLDLRRIAGNHPPSYIPDAIAELSLPTGPFALVVEVDTGTEGLTQFRTKVDAVADLWNSRGRCWGAEPGTWRPAVFVPSPVRARALARMMAAAGGGDIWLVAELPRLREVGPLGSLFATANEIAECPRGAELVYRGALCPSATETNRKVHS